MQRLAIALGSVLVLAGEPATAADPEPARAPTVADLLDGGARQLDGAAFKAALTGKTLKGTTDLGADWEGSFDADGTLNGTSYNAIGGSMWTRGKVMAFYGPYQIADDGRVCYQLQWSPGTGRSKACLLAFELKGDYYVAADAEPATRVFKRSRR